MSYFLVSSYISNIYLQLYVENVLFLRVWLSTSACPGQSLPTALHCTALPCAMIWTWLQAENLKNLELTLDISLISSFTVLYCMKRMVSISVELFWHGIPKMHEKPWRVHTVECSVAAFFLYNMDKCRSSQIETIVEVQAEIKMSQYHKPPDTPQCPKQPLRKHKFQALNAKKSWKHIRQSTQTFWIPLLCY